jgi:hypothetical protein
MSELIGGRNPVLPAQHASFVESVQAGKDKWIALRGSAGTGKSTALIAAVEAMSRGGNVVPRILIVDWHQLDIEQIAARLVRDIPSIPVTQLSKAALRELMVAGRATATFDSGVYLVNGVVAQHADVAHALAQTVWDLVVVEEDVPFRWIGLKKDDCQFQLGEAEPLLSRTVVTVNHTAAQNAQDHITAISLDSSLQALVAPIKRTLTYERTVEEQKLVTRLARFLSKEDISGFDAARLMWAMSSSAVALNHELVRLRNALAHGKMRLYDYPKGQLPGMWLAGVSGRSVSTPAEKAEDPRSVMEKALELAEVADTISEDSKLESVIALLERGVLPTPLVVFADHAATRGYLALMLAGGDAPVFSTSADLGTAINDLSVTERFIKDGGILITGLSALKGVDFPSQCASLHFDLPFLDTAMMARLTRFFSKDENSRHEAWALLDESGAFPVETATLREHGFEMSPK